MTPKEFVESSRKLRKLLRRDVIKPHEKRTVVLANIGCCERALRLYNRLAMRRMELAREGWTPAYSV